MIQSKSIPLAPTVEAINAWRGQQEPNTKPGDLSFGVNIRTKASQERCVTSAVQHRGEQWYWTIRGEGSSNGCREYPIAASKIVAATGWIVGDSDKIEAAGF